MIDQLIIGDKASYDDFEANVKERVNNAPKKKIIKATVPFSNVTHDFSAINGEIYWEERTLEYVFEITADTPEELEEKKQAFCGWIMNVLKEELHDPFIRDYHFIATYDDIDIDDSEVEKTTINVTFTAYPYMIADKEKKYTARIPAAQSKNFVTTSINTDGSIYNGTGYKENYRLNSSAAEVALAGAIISGFVPYSGEVLTAGGTTNSNPGGSGCYLNLYDSSFNTLLICALNNWVSYGATWTEADGKYTITIDPSAITNTTALGHLRSAAYIRVSFGVVESAEDFTITQSGLNGAIPQHDTLSVVNDSCHRLIPVVTVSGSARIVYGNVSIALGEGSVESEAFMLDVGKNEFYVENSKDTELTVTISFIEEVF